MLRRLIAGLFLLCVAAVLSQAAEPSAQNSNPAADLKTFRAYFKAKFPHVPFDDFVNGPYSVDKGMRAQWKQIMQFPPYDFALDEGKTLFTTPFANGKTYADCFPNKGIGIAQNYPYFDAKSGEIVTIETAINQCRQANGEKPLGYDKGPMASLSAYMAFTSRGKRFNIKVPNDPRALAAYDDGKKFFYERRGQLNFACSTCHVENAGKRMQADILAPAIGLVASLPIYRSDWGDMGTVARRFSTCSAQVRSTPLETEGERYRDLQYFLTYMSNGLPVAGPGTRP